MPRPAPALLIAALLAAAAPQARAEQGCPAGISGSGSAFRNTMPTGGLVACELPATSASEPGVAVGPAFWSGSAACGRCLRITGPAGTVVARVRDFCPECAGGQLDLNDAAMDAVAGVGVPTASVTWESVPCGFTTPVQLWVRAGSNPFFFELQIREHRHGIVSAALLSPPVILPRQNYNAFRYSGGMFTPPRQLRLVNVHGDAIIEVVTSIASETVFAGTSQFPDPSCVLGAPDPGGWIAANAAPNPFRSITRIAFTLAAPQRVTVDVFDLFGRRVARVHEGDMSAGERFVDWNGTDGDNAEVAPGVYRVRIAGPAGVQTVPVVRVK